MWLIRTQRQSSHTVLLSQGRGTFVQDVVLTFRQMLGGWPSYEKGTATLAYPNSRTFEKSQFVNSPSKDSRIRAGLVKQ